MGLFAKISAVWEKVSLVQRALLCAVFLTLVIVGALVVHWARQPDMRLLYQELSPEEASKITEKISEKGIAYALGNGGTTIYVPKEKVYQLRLDMAKEGLPSGEQNGYKIFDDEKIGTSPFVQNVNLKRALQEELARSIQMIDGVAHARVHIVSSEQTLFTSEAGKTTASVVLRLSPGHRLSGLNIAAITHLVSGSVEQLKPENITVIDSEGRLLSGKSEESMAPGAAMAQDYRERVEQTLADKVEDMLTAVLGPGRSTVKVSAVIDMNSTNIVKEVYDPTTKVATKEEITSGSEVKPGSSSEGEGVIPGGTKKDETIVTEYVVGKTVEQHVELPGEIKSLKVAAFVDLSRPDVNKAEAGAENEPIMAVSDIEEIIRNALGLKETDSLKVVNAKFYRAPEALIEEEQSSWPRYMAIARQASLGIMAICAFLVLKIFRGAKKKAGGGEQLQGTGANAGLLPGGVGNSEPLVLRRQISDALRSNPDQVRQLFYSWLTERQE
jgi:flagellar M-ring protein FliF